MRRAAAPGPLAVEVSGRRRRNGCGTRGPRFPARDKWSHGRAMTKLRLLLRETGNETTRAWKVLSVRRKEGEGERVVHANAARGPPGALVRSWWNSEEAKKKRGSSYSERPGA